MSEKPPKQSSEQIKESRNESILLDHIDEIALGAQIFMDLPIDPICIDGVKYSDCQKESIIVITDEKSFLGRRVAEFMVNNEVLEDDRNSEEPSDVFMELLNREDLKLAMGYYSKNNIELPDYAENQIIVAVIGDEQKVITLPLSN